MSEIRARELWDQADDLPNDPRKVELLSQAIREADAASWEEGSFDIRSDMMTAATFSGASEQLLAAFSWCLAKADDRPDLYDDSDLLWQYKWAISGARVFSGISVRQVDQMLDDFSQRLTKHGYTLRPVHGLRMRAFQDAGQFEEAKAAAQRMQETPRDAMADCEACELSHWIDLLCECKEHDRALEEAAPLLNGQQSCAEVPHETYPDLLLSAMRVGDMELAKRMHLRGYRLVYRGSDFLGALGKHAIYLARTKDIKKGADLVDKHIVWALDSMEASSQLDFYVGALAVARAAARTGQPTLAIRMPANHPAMSDGSCQLLPLIQWLEDQIQTCCAAFDQRNGTTAYRDRADDWLRLGA